MVFLGLQNVKSTELMNKRSKKEGTMFDLPPNQPSKRRCRLYCLLTINSFTGYEGYTSTLHKLGIRIANNHFLIMKSLLKPSKTFPC